MNLSGQQRKKLRDALISAFTEKSLLEQLLAFELDKKLNLIAQDNNLQTVVYKLIETSQAEEWLVDLVRAARKENSGNSELKAIAQELLPMMDKSSEMESDCSSNSTSVAKTPVTKATGKAIFVLSGTINAVDKEKLKAIEEHLRTILGDATLTITDVKEGSIKITLEGSLESLGRLKELVESGQLNEVLGLTIEEVQLVPDETLHNKNVQSSQDSNPNLRHNPIEVSELKAFILALYHLDAPLPDAVQAQINTINIPDDIRKLDAIANSYPPLETSYKQVWKSLDAIAPIRSKGIDSLPQPLPNSLNTEIDNSSRTVEDALIVFDQKVDSNQLVDISRQIVQALNSVKTARDIIQTILF